MPDEGLQWKVELLAYCTVVFSVGSGSVSSDVCSPHWDEASDRDGGIGGIKGTRPEYLKGDLNWGSISSTHSVVPPVR